MGAAPQSVTPWLLLDGPQGWEHRGRLADAVRAADARITELEQELAWATYRSAVLAHERDRLRNRRALRIASELAAVGDRPLAATVRGLKAATVPAATGAAPRPPALPPSATVAEDAVTAAAEQLAPTDRRPLRFPHVRVLHLGAVARFSGLASHRTIDPNGWREQLAEGADLLLLEPPSGTAPWDPVPGGLSALVDAARAAGIPTVRLLPPGAATRSDAPATDLELVEGAGDDRLPLTIDTSTLHPVGWRRVPVDPVVALATATPGPEAIAALAAVDPPVLLVHPPDVEAAGWRGRRRVVGTPKQLHRILRGAGVLLDHPDLHAEPVERQRAWHAARACGAPVVAASPDADDQPGLLPVDQGRSVDVIHGLLTDLDRRERHSIVGRRHALTVADREVAFRDLCDRLSVPLPPPPRTTVVLSTHRPEFLDHAARSIARQSQPGVDVVLVLHGAPDDLTTPDRFPDCTTVLRAPSRWVLGDCLNAGLDHATGQLIAKMDDDDHYGPEHLRDLVLAQRYSGADVVGKRIQFVHLAGQDVTVQRSDAVTESDRPHVGGPTILATAEVLKQTRFLRRPNRVDSTLYERVLAEGGRIYRTHSRDVILERHGDRHAWTVEDSSFREDSVRERPGLDIAMASSDPMDA